MALFFECMLSCARNLIDTADIVREAILQRRCQCPLLPQAARKRAHYAYIKNSSLGGCYHVVTQSGCIQTAQRLIERNQIAELGVIGKN